MRTCGSPATRRFSLEHPVASVFSGAATEIPIEVRILERRSVVSRYTGYSRRSDVCARSILSILIANTYIPQALCRDAHGLDRFKPAREDLVGGEKEEKRKTREEKNVEEKEREKKRGKEEIREGKE